jgi:hypothetical protein
VRRLAALSIAIVIAAAGCRSTAGNDERRRGAGIEVDAGDAAATSPEAGAGTGLPAAKTLKSKTYATQRKLAGFDRTGPTYCWSLPQAYDCLERPDKVAAACTAAGGEIQFCDDCRRLCSVPLPAEL